MLFGLISLQRAQSGPRRAYLTSNELLSANQGPQPTGRRLALLGQWEGTCFPTWLPKSKPPSECTDTSDKRLPPKEYQLCNACYNPGLQCVWLEPPHVSEMQQRYREPRPRAEPAAGQTLGVPEDQKIPGQHQQWPLVPLSSMCKRQKRPIKTPGRHAIRCLGAATEQGRDPRNSQSTTELQCGGGQEGDLPTPLAPQWEKGEGRPPQSAQSAQSAQS